MTGLNMVALDAKPCQETACSAARPKRDTAGINSGESSFKQQLKKVSKNQTEKNNTSSEDKKVILLSQRPHGPDADNCSGEDQELSQDISLLKNSARGIDSLTAKSNGQEASSDVQREILDIIAESYSVEGELTNTAEQVTEVRLKEIAQQLSEAQLTKTAQQAGEAQLTKTVQQASEAQLTKTAQQAGEAQLTKTTQQASEAQLTKTAQQTGEAQETKTAQQAGEVQLTKTVQQAGEAQETKTVQQAGEVQETKTAQQAGEAQLTKTAQQTGEAQETKTVQQAGEVQLIKTAQQAGEVQYSSQNSEPLLESDLVEKPPDLNEKSNLTSNKSGLDSAPLMFATEENGHKKLTQKEGEVLKQSLREKGTNPEELSAVADSRKSKSSKKQNEFAFKPVVKFAAEKGSKGQIEQNGSATDVKKLIDFEHSRLQAGKLGKNAGQSEEIQVSKNTDEGSKVSLLLNKPEAEPKNVIRDLNVTASNKTPPDAKEIVEQVVKKAELLLKLNSSEMKIQLKPEYLGKMTIKIVVDEGILTARFITESHQVKQLLESNMHSLRQSLESQGIKVEKTEVNVQLNNGGMFDGSEDSRQPFWQQHDYFPHYGREGNEEDDYPLMGENGVEEADSSLYDQSNGLSEDGSMSFLV